MDTDRDQILSAQQNRSPNEHNEQPPANFMQNLQPFTHATRNDPQINITDKIDEMDLSGRARGGFISKVYLLLTIQLAITVGMGAISMNNQSFRGIFVNTAASIIVSVLLMVVMIVMSCFPEVFRAWGGVIFTVFTLLFSLLVSIVICSYNSMTVLAAAGITLLVVTALTIFACVTKSDFTTIGPYMLVFSFAMLGFGIACIFIQNQVVQLIYASLSALMFGVYLIYDTQLVVASGKYSYTLDDAYIAAIRLYIDVIQLFLNILRILGQLNR